MTLDEYCQIYLSTRKKDVSYQESVKNFEEFVHRYTNELSERFARIKDEDIQWFTNALHDENRKDFVSFVFLGMEIPLPDALFAAMLFAALREQDPSFNGHYVKPCVRSFGHRRVNEFLLKIFEKGTDFEKEQTIKALYWAQTDWGFQGIPPAFKKEYAIPESVNYYEELMDVWKHRDYLFLQEFVKNSNLRIRQLLANWLVLDEDYYPDNLKHLVQEAIQIARNHGDSYIRERIEFQLREDRINWHRQKYIR